MHTPDADTAEHPDDDLWASLCFAGHDLMSQFAGNKEDIVGIGLGSIRCCRALLKADGTPAAPLISWQDARVHALTNTLTLTWHMSPLFRVI